MSNAPDTSPVPGWTLGDRLRKALTHGNVSVQAMADQLDVARSTISNYLHDNTRPRRSDIKEWALRCGVPYEWLLTGEVDDHHDDGPGSEVRTGSFATVAALDDYRRTGVELAPTGTG